MDGLFEALVDWNLWGDFNVDLKDREIIPAPPTGKMILSIMGVRRCGKSHLAYHLLRRVDEKNGLLINFEDPRLMSLKAEDVMKLVELYQRNVSESLPKILILDEVQNVKGWEKVARFYAEAKNVRVVVTGSSSKLMSEEYATVLTGRHLDFELFPLSFREVLNWCGIGFDGLNIYKNKVKIKRKMDEYLLYGGFPQVSLITDKREKTLLLAQYFEDIIMKDIVRRYRVREIEKISHLARLYLSNLSTVQSYNRIKNAVNLSLDSVERFSRYFSIARLFLFVPKFSYSIKQQILNPKKVYTIDTGLYSASGFKFSRNIGRIMENVVAIELMRRKSYWHREREIYYWKDHQGREVDFLVKEGEKVKELIQITYASGKDEIEKREIKALEKAAEELRCKKKTIITWDYEEEGEIKFIPLWKWLLVSNR